MPDGTSIVLKEGTKGIADSAFMSCSGLTNIDIPNSINYIGSLAFMYCIGLKSIDIPSSITYIASYAFCYCSGLTSINIPNSVTYIDGHAFELCSGLTSINVPNSVTKICLDAFARTPWYDNQPDGLVYAGLVAYKYKGTMPDGTSITLKEGTKGIADFAIAFYSGLTNIHIPNSVTNIGCGAFEYCTSLTSVTIPNSVTEIGSGYSDGAFESCTGLTSVTCLAVTPPIAGSACFSSRYYDSEPSIYDQATLYVPKKSLAAYQTAPAWGGFKTIVGIGDPLPGDINGDGELSIADVTTIINVIILGGKDPAMDVNGDGEVNLADVNMIINMLINRATAIA